MIVLLLGLFLWSASHLFKRLAPDVRAQMGDKAKGLVSLASIAGIILMVAGYRMAATDPVSRIEPLVHVNNLLMLVAIYLLIGGGMKVQVARRLRHPMLVSVILWGAAHLLVRHDLAAVVLFGGMILWSGFQMLLINRAEPDWTRPPEASGAKELAAVAVTIGTVAIVGAIHMWLGLWPFG